MSIDKRIVEMGFDNKQFERGIAESNKSLQVLKDNLNMDGATKSLNELEKTGKSFSLAGIAQGVETITNKFSALNIIGITTLTNLTNSALNAGKKILSALTIDPVKSGLEEYETKMNSIQTILTNTQSKGTTLDQVTDTLNDLNTYADKTIYNFAEMTRNIGTFTAAGIGLEESAIAIKGIANLAAGSGSNAQQASTAMYQLSQALASGTVKLQDWNSVVNAGMGGELFQNALKANAKQMGIFVDESIPFRETLKDGWLNADVLTKTLAQFAEDETLLQAATQVKTFTQMIDTMKESVQSGWSMSWEYILGDKDQAAALFTAINDGFGAIVGSSADARNEMLKFWNENGGRDAIIDALSNSFKGLASILTPIGKAFRNIFPATTGQQLVDISNKIKDLTENFKIGEETADKIGRTFEGFFALLDIGKQAIMAVAGGIGDLVSALLPAGDGILNVTASIGDFIVGLNNSLKSSNAFEKTINKISDVVSNVASKVKQGFDSIVKAFSNVIGIDLSSISVFSSEVERSFQPFTTLGNIVERTFSTMGEGVKKLSPVFLGFASIIGKAFSKLQEVISNAIHNADFKSMVDLLNGGLFAAILLGIKNFVKSLTDITDGASGMLDGITGILDGVKGSLEAYQSQLQAGTLIKIASAIGILAASLVALSMVDSDNLKTAMGAMSLMFVELFTSMAVFEKVMAGSGFRSMGKITTAMIALSTAILVLSSAVKKLADLSWQELLTGLSGVAALSAILVASAKALSTASGQVIKGSVGFVIFAAAINVLSDAVVQLGALDVASLTKGLTGVGVLMTELAIFMKATDLNKMGVTKSVGILILASAMVVMAEAIEKIGSIDVAGITKGLTAMGVVFTQVALFMQLTGGATKVTSTAIGMTILGAAMLVFSSAIESLGSMSIEQIAKGLIAMGGSLTIIAGALALLPRNMISQGAGLVVIATSLNILSSALNSMGTSSWEEIAKSLVTLAGSLGVISVAMMAMTGALPGASALLVISGALAALAPVLIKLGGMSIGEVGTSLLSLVGVFTVLGGTAVILGPLTPALLGLSGAIALLGAGSLAAGAGILAFSTGLAALAVSGTAGAAALLAVVTSLVGLIPFIANELATGIVEFIRILGDGAVTIAKAVEQIAIAILDVIINVTPKLAEAIGVLLGHLLDIIIDYVPKIVDGGIKLILGLLKGISDNIEKVVATAIDVVVNFIKGVTSRIPSVIQSGVDLIVGFINGLANAIRDNTDTIMSAIKNLFDAVIESAMKILFGSITGFIDVGGKIITGFIKGITDLKSKFINTMGDIISTGIDSLSKGVQDFANVGKNLIKGFIGGIKSSISSVARAAADLAKSALDSAKDVLGIHSPSREFESVGKFADEGMINGLLGYADKVANASASVGEDAKDALSNSLSNLSDIVNDDVDLNPAIRPVLDLSDVSSGVGMFNRLLGNKTVSAAASISGNIGGTKSSGDPTAILQRIADLLDKDPSDNPKPMAPALIFNIKSDTGNPMEISRQIQKDITGYNRAIGIG